MRAAGVVKQVLTFARGVEGERLSIQPGQLVKEMEGIIAETFPRLIHFDSRIQGDLPLIDGDPYGTTAGNDVTPAALTSIIASCAVLPCVTTANVPEIGFHATPFASYEPAFAAMGTSAPNAPFASINFPERPGSAPVVIRYQTHRNFWFTASNASSGT